jgi:hypothetical protein
VSSPQSEITLLNEIENELKSGSYGSEFIVGTGNCDPASIKISLETCDTDAAFIHEVCLQSTIGNDTLTCPANVISNSETYLHDRGITDPQTDALAYTRFTDVLQKYESKPIVGVVKIDTTKEGAMKHFRSIH